MTGGHTELSDALWDLAGAVAMVRGSRSWSSSSLAGGRRARRRAGVAPILWGTFRRGLRGYGSRSPRLAYGRGHAASYSLRLSRSAFLLGMLRMRLHRSAVGDLVVELGAAHGPAELRAMLARALGDPSLELAFWLPDRAHFVDAEGRPSRARDGGRGVRGRHDGEPLAALSYDASLLEDPTLLDHVTAAARLALENSRLQAELGARLLEVHESRARIVAADRRRAPPHRAQPPRRCAANAARPPAGAPARPQPRRRRPGGTRHTAAEIDTELQAAVELRAFAHGVHPPILTEEGLEPALVALARRATIPTQVNCRCPSRLPPPIETAAYYVAAEALANVIKHAHATHVRIDVSLDDQAR